MKRLIRNRVVQVAGVAVIATALGVTLALTVFGSTPAHRHAVTAAKPRPASSAVSSSPTCTSQMRAWLAYTVTAMEATGAIGGTITQTMSDVRSQNFSGLDVDLAVLSSIQTPHIPECADPQGAWNQFITDVSSTEFDTPGTRTAKVDVNQIIDDIGILNVELSSTTPGVQVGG